MGIKLAVFFAVEFLRSAIKGGRVQPNPVEI